MRTLPKHASDASGDVSVELLEDENGRVMSGQEIAEVGTALAGSFELIESQFDAHIDRLRRYAAG